MTLDTSKTYLTIEDTETVTFYQRQSDGSFDAGTSVAYAKRRAVSKTESNKLKNIRLTWHLWKDNLGSIVPKIGDKITDGDSVSWIIDREVRVQSLAQRFRCETKQVL